MMLKWASLLEAFVQEPELALHFLEVNHERFLLPELSWKQASEQNRGICFSSKPLKEEPVGASPGEG